METVVMILVWLVTVALVGILTPLGYALSRYFTGWVLSSVFGFAGSWIVSGLSALGIDITLGQLPIIGAALGFVGAFFRSIQKNENKNK